MPGRNQGPNFKLGLVSVSRRGGGRLRARRVRETIWLQIGVCYDSAPPSVSESRDGTDDEIVARGVAELTVYSWRGRALGASAAVRVTVQNPRPRNGQRSISSSSPSCLAVINFRLFSGSNQITSVCVASESFRTFYSMAKTEQPIQHKAVQFSPVFHNTSFSQVSYSFMILSPFENFCSHLVQ